MGEIFHRPRGTSDYLNNESLNFEYIRNTLIDFAKLYGCSYIMVPTYEENKLFHRTTGESSDIVTKETFNLVSRGDKEYTLRPEFTASINRAIIENKLYSSPDMPLKLSYFGPAFRYERPQAGRLREFNQFGVEFIDNIIDINTIIDCLLMSYESVKKIVNKDIIIKLNYLGSNSTREKYKIELKKYFENHINNMCEDCKRRYEINPLRILDCKIKDDKIISFNAPKITSYLSNDDRDKFNMIIQTLDKLKINYELNDHLVRGLDYYTGLVWELYVLDNTSLFALGGGGEYSSLSKDINGPELDGIGFSLGIERLLLTSEINITNQIDILIIDTLKNANNFDIAEKLRKANYKVTFSSLSRSLQGSLKMADRLNAKYAIIIDADNYKLKDLNKREQKEFTKKELLNFFLKKENVKK